MRQIDLDKSFRRGSRAYQVAERLMTGQPVERQQLVSELGVALTTVNRVVDVLREQGATIDRTSNGRRAIFQVVAADPNARHVRLPELDAEAQLISDVLLGDAHVVTLRAGRDQYRGVASEPVRVGDEGHVVGVMKDGSDVTLMVEVPGRKRVQLQAIQNVSEEGG